MAKPRMKGGFPSEFSEIKNWRAFTNIFKCWQNQYREILFVPNAHRWLHLSLNPRPTNWPKLEICQNAVKDSLCCNIHIRLLNSFANDFFMSAAEHSSSGFIVCLNCSSILGHKKKTMILIRYIFLVGTLSQKSVALCMCRHVVTCVISTPPPPPPPPTHTHKKKTKKKHPTKQTQ